MQVESYSTAATAPPDRAAHWSAVISDTYFPLNLTYRKPATFQGKLERRNTGLVSLSRLRTEPAQYERLPGLIRQNETAEYLVAIPSSAPVIFRQFGREVTCAPGGFILERGDEPYRFSYESPNDLLVMKVAHKSISERLRHSDKICATVFDGQDGLGGLFIETVRRIHSLSENLGAFDVLGRHLIELLVLALDRQAETDDAGSAIRAAHLHRAQEVIRRNFSNPDLSPEIVSAACGISKRYLHDIFSEANMTIVQYVRICRLHAARDLLQMPNNLTLAAIAYRLGFSDQAQFSRQFRTHFGQTPSNFRKSCR